LANQYNDGVFAKTSFYLIDIVLPNDVFHDFSFIEEIFSKNRKYFFYKRNLLEKFEIFLLWKK